ncbi:MAG: menaquinone biosynthesis decarboxylase [Nitrososphaeraceae archaeon]
MIFDSLSEYTQELERIGKLHRVKKQVDSNLEISEILRRMMYTGNSPAILFENIKGYDIPVVGNIFGSLDLIKFALDLSDFREIGSRISDLTKLKIPSGLFNKLRVLPKLSEIGDYAPKYVDSGPVTEIVKINEANLNSLPVLKSFQQDAGKFITFGLTITKHPETGIRNIGVYRIQLINAKQAIMHWQTHKRGAQHYELSKEKNNKIEVAIAIGTDPATIFSGVAPVPEGLDKFLFSGIVRKKGIKLVKCKTIDLEVPVNSEIVLEGYVDPLDIRTEGPFGDHTGYYTPPEPYPTFNLTGIMHRKNPLYLTTVVGKPILEDAYIGKVIEQSFLPLIQMFHPEVFDFSMPASGWFQGLAIISIKKRYPGQAKKVMMGLWGLGQLSLTKIFVVVDHDINVHDINDVIWAITTRSDPKRDTLIIDNTPTDTLDPSSPLLNLGSKMGIDATTKSREEGYYREVQKIAKVDKDTKQLVDQNWYQYGFK